MSPKPKLKSNSRKPQFENEYDEYEVFKKVRYWIYQRQGHLKHHLGKYFQAKIKMRNQPELRFSTGKDTHSKTTNFAKEKILESLFKVESGQTVKSRKFKDVSRDFLLDFENNPKTIPSKLKKFSSKVDNFFNPFFGKYPIENINEKLSMTIRNGDGTFRKNMGEVDTYKLAI
jgi:hypothetical protein